MEERYMMLDEKNKAICIVCFVRKSLGDRLGDNVTGKGYKCTVCGYVYEDDNKNIRNSGN